MIHDQIGEHATASPKEQRRTTKRLLPSTGAVVLAACSALVLAMLLPATAWAGVTASPVPPPGATGLQDLLNWTLYGGAIACAATSMYGFAKMGISHTQQSYQGANHGKSVAILGMVGALGLGLTPTIVNGLTAIH